MKKVQFTLVLLVALVAGIFVNASAQRYELENVLISSYQLKEGNNTVPVPGNRGTLRFMYRGGNILNVMLQDAAGQIIRVGEETDPAAGNPNPVPTCKGELRCSFSQKYNTTICFCIPELPLSSGAPVVQIGLLLPAIQKVREAASRH
jgi:hypothetical protein